MANKFTIKADLINETAQAESLKAAVQTTSARQLLQNASPVLQTLNTEVMLSSSLLKYDLTFKPPAKEVFSIPEPDQQASIAHIDQLNSVLSRFNASLKTLQDDLGQHDENNQASLQAKTKAFLEKYRDDVDVGRLLKQQLVDGRLKSFQDIFAARQAGAVELDGQNSLIKDDASKLFHSGRQLLKETQTISEVHNQLLLLQRAVLKRLLTLREEKQQLAVSITEARQQLDSLNRTRLEDTGDYALAQRLVTEDWQQVEQRFQHRRKVLENYSGLYYVRVRETSIGRLLPDALSLRSQSPGDVVPGCGDTDVELADDLLPFMDTLLDMPLVDWRQFQHDAHLLPSRSRQTQLFEQRQQRLQSKVRHSVSNSSQQTTKLTPLLQINRQLLTVFAGKSLQQTDSLQQQFDNAHRLLSLEDVLNGSRNLLSERAQILQQQLTQASGCFLEQLAGIQPSIRFRWAQLVEDRNLPIEQPERWPQLADVAKADFNRARTLVELVAWFYRQLADDASDTSRTAVTHLLSACLLIAASDDPQQILYGNLQTLPGVFRPGELLRLNLNRDALPGTQLHLLDAQRQVVGMLRVDDQDKYGVVATLIQVYQPITIREGLSVTGKLAKSRAVK